jgi:hypothetical protein
VPGGQGAEGAQQVGDGAAAEGEDGREGEQEEPGVSRARERRFEGIKDGTKRPGKLLTNPPELAPGRSGLACLLASLSTELFPEVFRGKSRAGSVG